ncbi:hypothetical protein UA08_00541 [Talaromyces atroroseus]|uniref:BTB domain-containing protein n=1 Tax=Talaromyces atroroseus TaxID=1441469 RepID=A0A225B3J9_TALAT|nr:hypothetical protein UA08_00541 [Talaromyces atroroseus]OKL64288.1 hypothetical protein UA08_00541 [Talaromyces atroroseus]
MEGRFGMYISSPIFTFQVGQERKEVIVHSGPLAGLSPALDTLMNGQMLEAKLRRVDWSDVKMDTFAQLCEFAYSQDYTPPTYQQSSHFSTTSPSSKKGKKKTKKSDIPRYGFTGDEPVPEPETERGPPSEPGFGVETNHAFELPLKQRTISERDLRNVFLDLEYPPFKSTYQFKPEGNESPTQDFTHVLVGHAELYVLADNFTVYETNVVCITEFLRFVYQNTPPLKGEIDPLRNLASRYVASILGQIGDIETFKQLLAEGGDFVIDFWNLIWAVDIPSRSVLWGSG